MNFGGTEQVVKQLIMGTKHSFEHYILCLDGQIGEFGLNFCEQHSIPYYLENRFISGKIKVIDAIKRHMTDKDIDIIHCHQYTPFFFGTMASFFKPVQVVFTEHGRFHPDSYRYKYYFINKLLQQRANNIVAISEATKLALSKYEFLSNRKIEVIYNGIDNDSVEVIPKYNTDKIHLGSIGRLSPEKNQAALIRLVARLRKDNINAYLTVFGDGEERGKLEKLVEKLELQEYVSLPGFTSKPLDELQKFTIFLLPSYTEGTSMTLLEAMQSEVPIIASSVGGTPEIITHELSGVLLEPEDVEGMAKYCFKIVNDHEFRNSIVENAKTAFNSNFTIHEMCTKYINIYNQG